MKVNQVHIAEVTLNKIGSNKIVINHKINKLIIKLKSRKLKRKRKLINDKIILTLNVYQIVKILININMMKVQINNLVHKVLIKNKNNIII